MKIDKDFNPYPGLRSFGPELADFFFGRERQIFQLLRILRKQRFIAVLGSSGSGKSSLVMAGLLPVLNNPKYVKSEKSWSYTIVQPENDPIGNLASSLNRDILNEMDEEQREYTNSTLRLDINGIATTLKQAKFTGNLLIVIDQFEELFTHKEGVGSDREEVLMFNQLLLQAARQDEVQLYFVITMRSEYIGRCMELPGLVDLINKSQFLLPVMTRDDYREVIHHPAEKLNVSMNPFFVSSVLNDIEDREDQLPLLQHVLRRSWHLRTPEQKEANEWPIDTYKKIGRLRAALNLHAQSLYDNLPSEKHRICCEIMFRRITRQTGKEDGVRVPKTFGHIASCANQSLHSKIDSIEEARQVLGEVFMTFAGRDAGMLRKPDESRMNEGVPKDDAVVYIMHESLIRKWDKLRTEWLPKETEKVTFYRQMEEAYEDFRDGKGKRLDGTLLGTAITWKNSTLLNAAWVETFSKQWNEVIEFIRESERKRRAAFMIRRGANIAMGIAIVILLGVAAYVYNDAELAKTEASAAAAKIKSVLAEADSLKTSRAELKKNLTLKLDSARHAKVQADSATARALRARAKAEAAEIAARKQSVRAEKARILAHELKIKAEGDAQKAFELAEEARAQELRAVAAMDSALRLLADAKISQNTADSLQQAADDVLDDYNALIAERENRSKANTLLTEYLKSSESWGRARRLAVLHAIDSLDPGNDIVRKYTEDIVFPTYFNPDKLTSSNLFIAGNGNRVLVKRDQYWKLYDPFAKEYVDNMPTQNNDGKVGTTPFIISSNMRFIAYLGEGRTVAIIDLMSSSKSPLLWTRMNAKATDLGNIVLLQAVYFNTDGNVAAIYSGDGRFVVNDLETRTKRGSFEVTQRKCGKSPCGLALSNNYALTIAGPDEAGECFSLTNGDELKVPDDAEVKAVFDKLRNSNVNTAKQIDYKTHLSRSKLSTKAIMNLLIFELKEFNPSLHEAFINSLIAKRQTGQKGQ